MLRILIIVIEYKKISFTNIDRNENQKENIDYNDFQFIDKLQKLIFKVVKFKNIIL